MIFNSPEKNYSNSLLIPNAKSFCGRTYILSPIPKTIFMMKEKECKKREKCHFALIQKERRKERYHEREKRNAKFSLHSTCIIERKKSVRKED